MSRYVFNLTSLYELMPPSLSIQSRLGKKFNHGQVGICVTLLDKRRMGLYRPKDVTPMSINASPKMVCYANV